MSNEINRRKRRGEREDGRILVTLAIGVDEKGKTVRKYFYGNTREEAEKKRDRYKRERELGMSDLADSITVSEWITMWFEKYKSGIEPASAKNYNALIVRLNRRMGKRLVRSIVEADLQVALYEVAGMSTSTIEKYHSFIHQVFSRAARNRIIVYDPSDDLQLPSGFEGTHRALERWESDLILSNWHQHRCGIWAMLMLLTGLRRGEMIALEWQDVDMVNRKINIHQAAFISSNRSDVKDKTKTTAGMRVLPICQPLWEALNTVPVDKRTGFVCLSAAGKQITGCAFKRGWEGFNLAMRRILNGEPLIQQGRRTDLEDDKEQEIVFSIRAHDLRHTFATALYDAGIGVKAAQYYLGHADMRMTLDLYTHLSAERERRERSELTTFLDAWMKPIEADPQNGISTALNIPEVTSKNP